MPVAENGALCLHYELSGAPNGEPLVLINSLGSNLRMWDKVLPQFEMRFRVVRFDTRGHGASSVPPAPYTIEQLGGDMLFLMDRLGIERANICGISLGGLVGLWMGVRAPGRVRRLVLANTAARVGTRKRWEERAAAVRASGMASLATATVERWFTPAYRDTHSAEMEAFRAMISATDAEGYARCCDVLRDTDLCGEIASIETPCLVISGTHDAAIPPEEGRRLQAALRNSAYLELDASHLSAWEQSDQFAAAVLEFLSAREKERAHG